MQQKGKLIQQVFEAQAFSWAVIDQVFDTSDPFVACFAEVGTLGQVPSDETVDMLVGATFPLPPGSGDYRRFP